MRVQQIAGMNVLVDRLFWATFEMAILASVVWMAFRLFRGLSPRARALLWLLVLVKPIVAPAFGAPVPIFRVSMEQPAPSQETPVYNDTGGKAHRFAPFPGQSICREDFIVNASVFSRARAKNTASIPSRRDGKCRAPAAAASTSTAQKIAGIARRAWADLPGSLMMYGVAHCSCSFCTRAQIIFDSIGLYGTGSPCPCVEGTISRFCRQARREKGAATTGYKRP
jgi:hypothetical protein